MKYNFTDLRNSGVSIAEISESVYEVSGSGACGFLFALADGKWAYQEVYSGPAGLFVANTAFDAVYEAINEAINVKPRSLSSAEFEKWE